MEYAIHLPELPNRQVTVQSGGAFSGAKLLVDGVPVRPERGRYLLQDAAGNAVEVRLKAPLFDTVPGLQVNGRDVRIVPPLKWYEYVWACLPFLLVLGGGALGGGLGAMAAYGNVAVFRSDMPAPLRYLVTGGISVAAFVFYMVGGALILGGKIGK